VYRSLNRWSDEEFTFLVSDVSIFSVYLLVQMLFWQLMYLQGLIFAVTDAIFLTNVSATCFSLSLQILLSLPVMYKLHLHLAFSGI